MPGIPFERLWRRLDPRRSVGARLLVAFVLAFLLPAGVFLFLVQRRLTELQTQSQEQVAALRVSEAGIRMAQDAANRADWLAQRARTIEESARSLAAAARLALEGRLGPGGPVPHSDSHGRVWTAAPEEGSVAYLDSGPADLGRAASDIAATRPLAPLMADLRRRRPSVRTARVWTASGAIRESPWDDLDTASRMSRGAKPRRSIGAVVQFPEAPPASGDESTWTDAPGEGRFAEVFVPVRAESGRLLGVVGLEVDAGRYVAEALESSAAVGDVCFATDSDGHALFMTPRAAAALGWPGGAGSRLSDAPSPEAKRLAVRARGVPRSNEEYVIDGKPVRIASARVEPTGWVFYEGLSAEAMETVRGEGAGAFPPTSLSMLKRDVLLLFMLLIPAVVAVLVMASRRISSPVQELTIAAEEIGRGRAVNLAARRPDDELGRLAAAIDAMAKRVARRVETLRRLHLFSRSAYRMTDAREVIARATQAIAGFTQAERVWFYLHDRNTNRLEAALPAWNLTEEAAQKLRVSVDARSIEGMVFRTGEPYCSNALAADPYANRELQQAMEAVNGVFAPLKTEEETLGVAVAINRQAGFGQEEIDAMTSFADLASLLLKNARLYATLSGTVDELRRASRLKDHFLQNVNHELRTPLTAIVGWTDLFEEQTLDEKTLKRGLRQIRQSARVLLALIDDLLDLARLDRGALTLELRPVSLSEVLQRSLDTVRLMAEARGVVLILAPLPEPMAPLRADALRLQQILWNLLANAIQFTPQHGRVVVRVDREPERYLVSVEDDGIGIPESELPHVFERFRQVDGSPTRAHAGMGIGLALARSLVELHGGAIWASSVVGQGSRFTFALPIRPAERRATSSGVVEASAAEIG